HDSEARRRARAAGSRRRRLAGRVGPRPRALRLGPRQLHRNPHGRSGSLPAAAAARANARQRAEGARRAVPLARRGMAAMNNRNGAEPKKLKGKKYEKELTRLQAKLCSLQEYVKEKGGGVVV